MALNGGRGRSTYVEMPTNTVATVYVHNHPSSDVHPTHLDVINLLKVIDLNPRMRYGVIAATEGGIVSGYLVMEYVGKRGEAKSLLKRNEKNYSEYCDFRHREIEEHPERFDFTVGDDIFSIEEQKRIGLEFMSRSKIISELFVLPEYQSYQMIIRKTEN